MVSKVTRKKNKHTVCPLCFSRLNSVSTKRYKEKESKEIWSELSFSGFGILIMRICIPCDYGLLIKYLISIGATKG